MEKGQGVGRRLRLPGRRQRPVAKSAPRPLQERSDRLEPLGSEVASAKLLPGASPLNRKSLARLAALIPISATLLATLAINFFTLSQVPRAITSVPWWDEWDMIREYINVQRGQPLWPVLWSSYWGHRMVIGRLIF